MSESCAAVFRWQGFCRSSAFGRESLSARPVSFSLAPHRHRPQFPGSDRVSRQKSAELGERLIVRSVEDSIKQGKVILKSPNESRNVHQSVTLLDTIEEFRFDACIGGARRDEEKARAKERIFSFRDEFGQLDPKNQRPELWDLYNTRVNAGENI